MKPRVFIFIGMSGCGKGTQAELLIELLKKKDPSHDVLYVQTGQSFRNLIKNDSFTARKTKEIINAGDLVPEFLAIHIWSDMLVDDYKEGDHIIFDGTPRKFHEAEVLDSVFGFYGLTKPTIVYLDISHDEAMKRLLRRKRADDTPASIEERLGWYEKEVVEALKFFEDNPNYLFLKIDGERSVEEIHEDIAKKVGLN
jgi:adenylate kinase family enzyme